MTPTQYNVWQEQLKLVAQYDWAVEGGTPPEGNTLTREEARLVRESILKGMRESR